MEDILQKISDIGVLPVIKIEDLHHAVPLAMALRKGGINAIEITIRNAVAIDAIRAIVEAYPDMMVGAGTVLSAKMADAAMEAGAKYIVCPGFDPGVVAYCMQKGISVVPGCVTPSEVNEAVKLGLKILKFFPAEANGGVEAIKLLAGPFAGIRFLPTGGINYSNLENYLRYDAVAACGGSFMAKADAIRAGKWDEISAACQRAVMISLGFSLAHVGLNHRNEAEAAANAEALNSIFSLGIKNGNSSLFCGKEIEFMKKPFYGKKGHIGFYSNSVARALAYFKGRGVNIREESIRRDADGKLVSFYIQQEIGGFALHIVRK